MKIIARAAGALAIAMTAACTSLPAQQAAIPLRAACPDPEGQILPLLQRAWSIVNESGEVHASFILRGTRIEDVEAFGDPARYLRHVHRAIAALKCDGGEVDRRVSFRVRFVEAPADR